MEALQAADCTVGSIWATICAKGSETAMRQVILYYGEDGYWVVECPSLPGCISQGQTKEQAIANVREAIQGYIAALEEDGLPVPQERFELGNGVEYGARTY